MIPVTIPDLVHSEEVGHTARDLKPLDALNSMVSDMQKHPELEKHPGLELGVDERGG